MSKQYREVSVYVVTMGELWLLDYSITDNKCPNGMQESSVVFVGNDARKTCDFVNMMLTQRSGPI